MTPPEEGFTDPLENYDPKTYDDPVERALAEQTAEAIQATPFVSIAPDTPVAEAVEKLATGPLACLVVEEEEKLVGLFAERDVLDKVALRYDEVRDQPVSEVMTPDPVCVLNTDSPAAVLNVMAISGYRHVPVVTLDGKPLGVATPQRVTSFLRSAFESA